ncbi:hypothetical protein Q4I30_003555 [Leishmania utingensis]|uniref:Uncharacterized protein n=1 Tax=Leishmania utingensis TaxID=653362 RepID=A0AAW3AM43_9TRYP
MQFSAEHGTVAHNYVTFYTMDTTEEVLIYMPPSYHKPGSETRLYPVLYLLHNDCEQAMNCVQEGKVNIIVNGKITIVIVMKSSVSTRGDGECLPCDADHLCEDLTKDSMPQIDSHYRTEADCDNCTIVSLYTYFIKISRLCTTRHDLFAYAGVLSGFLRTSWNSGSTDGDHIDDLCRHRAVFESDDALLAELGEACERRIYAGLHSWQV